MNADLITRDKINTVPELARELGLTERSIRFYESKGLLSPKRAGNTRVFTYKDRARLIIIMRGKRTGTSLADIKKILDLYDADPKHHKQAKAVLNGIKERITIFEEQREELKIVLDELELIKNNCLKILGKDNDNPSDF